MAGFVAADKVEPLAYDFTGAPGFTEAWPGAGVVAEPSAVLLSDFLTGMFEFRKALIAASTAAEAGDTTAMDAFAGTATFDKVRDLVIAVCNGTPTAEALTALPPRYMTAFTAWLHGELGGGDPKD